MCRDPQLPTPLRRSRQPVPTGDIARDPEWRIAVEAADGRVRSPHAHTTDAVIIGAGHNGLVAANLLADAGWSVVVLEASDHAGGAVHTAEITAPGFTNDLCSAFYPFAAVSPIIRGLHLEEHGLQWRHAPHVLAHVFRDDRAAILDRDPDVTAASVEEFAAGDGDRWLREVAAWQRIGADFIDALFTPFPPVRPRHAWPGHWAQRICCGWPAR